MTIQFASDLHLEFPENRQYLELHPLKPAGDVLILAGDIIPFAMMETHNSFLDYISKHFPLTYWVPGNHEYYRWDINDRNGVMREKIRENILLVNNVVEDINGCEFLFSTLWSRISVVNQFRIQAYINDFRLIRNGEECLAVADFNQLHTESMAFLSNAVKASSSKARVIVTHHVPTLQYYPEKHKGDILNEAFATDLDDFIQSCGASHWIYGHHHFNQLPFQVGTTLCLTNQLGYVRHHENEGFIDNITFDSMKINII